MTKVRVYELGPNRWHMSFTFDNGSKNYEFENWMQSMYPDCMCVFRSDYGGGPGYYELRGGDPDDQTLIALTWGGNNS